MLLKGHFAELAATNVTGFAAGSAQAVATYTIFAHLCAQYPEITASPDEMFKSMVRDSLKYLSGAFNLIEEAHQLDSRLHGRSMKRISVTEYERPFAGVTGLALDLGLVLDRGSNMIVPYLIEANSLGSNSFGRIGIGGLWRSRPDLAEAFRR